MERQSHEHGEDVTFGPGESVSRLIQSGSTLAECCRRMERMPLPSDHEILTQAGLDSGHPWAFMADRAHSESGCMAYYRYLLGLARLIDPEHILEIGTAFGMSGAALIQGAAKLERFISLDIGLYTAQYEVVKTEGWDALRVATNRSTRADGRNIAFARERWEALIEKMGRQVRLCTHMVNTQPRGSDDFGWIVDVPFWRNVDDLVLELELHPIDLLFVDGKHVGDGLYQDLKSFFPYVRSGGLAVCDDLHDESFRYDWAGQTLASFRRFREELAHEIADSFIWPFPQIAEQPERYDQAPAPRPFGLILKK